MRYIKYVFVIVVLLLPLSTQELTAAIDGLTGGYLSRRMGEE